MTIWILSQQSLFSNERTFSRRVTHKFTPKNISESNDSIDLVKNILRLRIKQHIYVSFYFELCYVSRQLKRNSVWGYFQGYVKKVLHVIILDW